MLLDIGLPDGEGFSVLEYMKSRMKTEPVLIISARNSLDDKLRGLNIGADDYLTKPFAFPELAARIEALLRRRDVQSVETKLTVGDLELDLLSRKVRRGDRHIADLHAG